MILKSIESIQCDSSEYAAVSGRTESVEDMMELISRKVVRN